MIQYRQPFEGTYPITQGYGEVIPGVTYKGQPHTGLDYACPTGTPILASAEGVVRMFGNESTGYGKYVILEHPDGKATVYAHLWYFDNLSIGKRVKQGDVIAHSGSSGNSTGPHLHFEARSAWNNVQSHQDPITFLPLTNVIELVFPGTSSAAAPLKDADRLPETVQVVAPAGAKRFNPDWTMPTTGFQVGTVLHFTGKTVKRPGYPYTYCEVYEEPRKYYVAVNDGVDQILDAYE